MAHFSHLCRVKWAEAIFLPGSIPEQAPLWLVVYATFQDRAMKHSLDDKSTPLTKK